MTLVKSLYRINIYHKKIYEEAIRSLPSAQETFMDESSTPLYEILEKTSHDVTEFTQVPEPPDPNTYLQYIMSC
jgi:hypothetical protein